MEEQLITFETAEETRKTHLHKTYEEALEEGLQEALKLLK